MREKMTPRLRSSSARISNSFLVSRTSCPSAVQRLLRRSSASPSYSTVSVGAAAPARRSTLLTRATTSRTEKGLAM